MQGSHPWTFWRISFHGKYGDVRKNSFFAQAKNRAKGLRESVASALDGAPSIPQAAQAACNVHLPFLGARRKRSLGGGNMTSIQDMCRTNLVFWGLFSICGWMPAEPATIANTVQSALHFQQSTLQRSFLVSSMQAQWKRRRGVDNAWWPACGIPTTGQGCWCDNARCWFWPEHLLWGLSPLIGWRIFELLVVLFRSNHFLLRKTDHIGQIHTANGAQRLQLVPRDSWKSPGFGVVARHYLLLEKRASPESMAHPFVCPGSNQQWHQDGFFATDGAWGLRLLMASHDVVALFLASISNNQLSACFLSPQSKTSTCAFRTTARAPNPMGLTVSKKSDSSCLSQEESTSQQRQP